MRPSWVLVLLLAASLLAGCTQNEEDPLDETGEEPPAKTGPEDKKGEDEDPTVTSPENLTRSHHLFDLRELEYEAALKRYELVANSDLELAAEWEFAVGEWTSEEDCASLAVQVPGATDTAQNSSMSLVAWSWRNNLSNKVTVLGTQHSVGSDLTHDESGGFSTTGNGTIRAKIPEGKRVLVEIGGLTGSIAQGQYIPEESPNDPQDNRFALNLTYKGDAELRELDEAPLRCGASPQQAEDATLGLHGYLQVLVDGTIGLKTESNSTLLFLNGASSLNDLHVYRAHFLDQVHENPMNLALSTNQGGELAIEFENWAEAFPTTPLWFMADTHWPWIHGQEL